MYWSWTSEEWREYFHRNALSLLAIPWQDGVTLTDGRAGGGGGERAGVPARRVVGGQALPGARGRTGSGRGTCEYVYALRLFIAEENRHARDLGRVHGPGGDPRTGHTWPDAVFRWLRHRAGPGAVDRGAGDGGGHRQGVLRRAARGDGVAGAAAAVRPDPARRGGPRAVPVRAAGDPAGAAVGDDGLAEGGIAATASSRGRAGWCGGSTAGRRGRAGTRTGAFGVRCGARWGRR